MADPTPLEEAESRLKETMKRLIDDQATIDDLRNQEQRYMELKRASMESGSCRRAIRRPSAEAGGG